MIRRLALRIPSRRVLQRAVGKSRVAVRSLSGLGISRLPEPYNEPLRNYAPGSPDALALKEAVKKVRSETVEIPCIVNGEEIKTGDVKEQLIPSDHKQVVARFHQANAKVIEQAIEGSIKAKAQWEELPFEDRAAVFLKAADLVAGKYRYEMLATTMLGQGKNVWQAEIDAGAEVIDFLRFNPKYAEEIYSMQPPKNSVGVWNRMEYRPLEGFVLAVSPFNFTAIGSNLPTSPAMMGNVVLWKPASTAVLSNYLFYKILTEAGLPPGVIQFIPGSGGTIGNLAVDSKDFAGLHFTGSTGVFNGIMARAASNLQKGLYKGYPRIVGETGGKDFHFVHESADLVSTVNHTLRGAFEYQGQKCSACSRAYVPAGLWSAPGGFKERLLSEVKKIKVGQPDDFSIFMTAVIDRNSFKSIKKYIDSARAPGSGATIVAGGGTDDSKGFFVEPTVIEVSKPDHTLMREEIFGPVLTVYPYKESYDEALALCDATSPYALTGSIFARDRYAIAKALQRLRHAAGNFYINDKCTGAVVGQQPFGGARASGTNDKAGASLNLLRWVSARAIKETFVPQPSWTYPHMA